LYNGFPCILVGDPSLDFPSFADWHPNWHSFPLHCPFPASLPKIPMIFPPWLESLPTAAGTEALDPFPGWGGFGPSLMRFFNRCGLCPIKHLLCFLQRSSPQGRAGGFLPVAQETWFYGAGGFHLMRIDLIYKTRHSYFLFSARHWGVCAHAGQQSPQSSLKLWPAWIWGFSVNFPHEPHGPKALHKVVHWRGVADLFIAAIPPLCFALFPPAAADQFGAKRFRDRRCCLSKSKRHPAGMPL